MPTSCCLRLTAYFSLDQSYSMPSVDTSYPASSAACVVIANKFPCPPTSKGPSEIKILPRGCMDETPRPELSTRPEKIANKSNGATKHGAGIWIDNRSKILPSGPHLD